jgi:hypothetical protein
LGFLAKLCSLVRFVVSVWLECAVVKTYGIEHASRRSGGILLIANREIAEMWRNRVIS